MPDICMQLAAYQARLCFMRLVEYVMCIRLANSISVTLSDPAIASLRRQCQVF